MTKLSPFGRRQEKRVDHPGLLLQLDPDWRVVANRLTLDFVVQRRERPPHQKTCWLATSRFKTRVALAQHLKKSRRCSPKQLKQVDKLPMIVGAYR